VAGPDGAKDHAIALIASGYYLQATDAGMPSGLASRTFGGWFKTASSGTIALLGWGGSPNHIRWYMASGNLASENGGDGLAITNLADGEWHHIVEVHDNGAADGAKRKLYLDGRIVATSLVMNSITLAGANRFKVGANPSDGSLAYPGQIGTVFVYAGVLTGEQIRALYNKSSQALAPSPKAEGDHIEAVEVGRLLAHFDSINPHDTFDLSVMP